MINPEVEGDTKHHEITTGGTLNITRKWKFISSITRDLIENQNTSKSYEIKYNGSCVEYSLSMKQYNPIDQQEADTNIDFRFNIKANLF
jgi:lipopolysaccharide assembly outer membrane protein LptD (OstA)